MRRVKQKGVGEYFHHFQRICGDGGTAAASTAFSPFAHLGQCIKTGLTEQLSVLRGNSKRTSNKAQGSLFCRILYNVGSESLAHVSDTPPCFAVSSFRTFLSIHLRDVNLDWNRFELLL